MPMGSENTSFNRFSDISLTLAFSLIALGGGFLLNNPSMGYEVSIYSATPIVFWICLLISQIIGIVTIVRGIFSSNRCNHKYVALGFCLVILGNVLLLFMPLIRGYAFYGRWDTPMHAGWIKDMLFTHHVPDFLIYPVSHTLIATISTVLNVDVFTVIDFMMPFFAIMFALFIYPLAKMVLHEKTKIYLALLFATVLLFSYTSYQVLANYFANVYTLLFIYAFFSFLAYDISKPSRGILFFIISITMVLFHTVTTVTLIISCSVIFASYQYIHARDFKSAARNMVFLRPVVLLAPIILFISWISAHSYFWEKNSLEVVSWIVNGSQETSADQAGSFFGSLNFNVIDIFELSVKLYGHVILFLICVAMGLVFTIRFFNSYLERYPFVILLDIYFITTLTVLFVNFFLTIINFGFWRLLLVSMVIAPILIGFFMDEFYRNLKSKMVNYFPLVIATIIIVSTCIGIFSTYPSPYTMQANHQVTEHEIVGMKWYYELKDTDIPDKPLRMDYRYYVMIFGTRFTKDREDISFSSSESQIPDHFGNMGNATIDRSRNFNTYVPLSKYDHVYYIDLYGGNREFNSNDFQVLEVSPTVLDVYNNGELNVLLIDLTN